MKLFTGGQLEAVDARHFVGVARVKRLRLIENGDGEEAVIVYLVQFEPGGRTNWHRHSAPQLLLVKEGQGLVQKWGEPVRHIAAGDAVTIEPNEKHWHGAAAETRMAHFAVNLNLTTEWLEPVSDSQYRAS
jgi:quercetin dioxygenase-like cupin family protein